MKRIAGLLALWAAALPAPAAQPQEAAPDREGLEFFEKKIRPVLAEHCYSCHSQGASKVRGGLVLDTREGLLKGGNQGPAVVPGDPERSLLVLAVRHDDEDLQMPPKKGRLPTDQIAAIESWVRAGAPHPHSGGGYISAVPPPAEARRHWPYVSLRPSALPAVRDASWPRNEIDRFVLAKLEEKGLRPVAEADRRTLIRRASFDLLGLPPTPEEVEAFVADERPDAWERLVERLLASPHYGERWGRHWMDVIRYADTAGDNSDYPIPQIYRYRDWIIDAFNRDLPYDEFIRRQIAGDLLPYSDLQDKHAKIVATGYLANARRFGSRVADYPWHLTIEDTLDNLGKTFLGLTLACARCHDHKFDPISLEDYYALYGIFESVRYPWPGIELDKTPRDLVPIDAPGKVQAALAERAAGRARHDAEIKALEAERAGLERAAKAEVPAELEDEAARLKSLIEELATSIDAAKKARDRYVRSALPFETAYAVAEAKKPGNAKVQIKGDPERPGKEVPRRFLEVLGGQALPEGWARSGRLELAQWIADPANPLTARVMANRIWHWHFGRGIVATPSDFGKQGHPPTHPELLDWLAHRFVEGGWSVKALHRLILASRTYRLSSADDPANVQIDPSNTYLWKFSRRRLDAESIRDAFLAVSGALDPTPAPPHPFPPQETWNFTQHVPFRAVYDSHRRSVYLMTQRIQRHPYLAIFDGPDTNASTDRRVTSTTPLQALYLMNDPFVHDQARRLARRLLAEAADDATRLDRAYRLAFGRPPSAEERRAGLAYLIRAAEKLREAGAPAEEAWESYARILFRLNEFVYVH